MIRVFLDANILFSAAYREGAGLTKLWHLTKVRLVSSNYAVEEARRNLAEEDQLERLAKLIKSIDLVSTAHQSIVLPKGFALHDKDQPILSAADGSKLTFFVT